MILARRVACATLALVSAASAQTAPALVSRATVFEYPKSDPYDRTNDYGFNHAPSVTRLSDGRLMAAWFSGPYEGSVHQVILGSTSGDDGASWSPAAVVNDVPRKSDFDPAFLIDGRRTWLFFSAGRWNRYPFVGTGDVAKAGVGIDSFGVLARHTDDGGKTWSEPVPLDDLKGTGVRSNGVRLSTGELLVPRHHYVTHACSVTKSTDGGETWRTIEGPKAAEKVGSAEPCLAETASGGLVMVVRSRDGFLWTTRSADKGETWSPLEKSDVPAAASSHSLLKLSDGRLLLTHNPSSPPDRTPLTARISGDEGKTWGEPLAIAEADPNDGVAGAWSRQVSYPSAVELADGNVGVVWTAISMSAEQQRGVIRFARIKVK